jgi:hypothetical protein
MAGKCGSLTFMTGEYDEKANGERKVWERNFTKKKSLSSKLRGRMCRTLDTDYEPV